MVQSPRVCGPVGLDWSLRLWWHPGPMGQVKVVAPAMTSPRTPTSGFWLAVALVAVLVGYPLSFGPACWWISRREHLAAGNTLAELIGLVYVPCGRLAVSGPSIIADPLCWYVSAGIPDRGFIVPVGWRKWGVSGL